MSDLLLLQSLHHIDEHRGMPLHARMIKVAYIAHATYLFQAQMLLEGEGCQPDQPRAARLLGKALELGMDSAYPQLGYILARGDGDDDARIIARRLLRQGSARGNASAMAVYGKALMAGQGVEEDEAKARELLEATAKAGHAEGKTGLGLMALLGAGEEKNPEKGLALLDEASMEGSAEACYYAFKAYGRGENGAPQDMAKASLYRERGDACGLRGIVDWDALLAEEDMEGDVQA